MRTVLRWLGRIAVAIVLLAVVAGVGAWFYIERSLPQLAGETTASGLAAAVEVVRDEEGIPHVFAKSERDGWFAVGYLHAQDRLWQMEVQRRVAYGRIAEVFGERAFDVDRLMRTLGFGPLSGQIVARMDEDTRGALEAYSAGVNAYLATNPVLPVEFQVFRVKPDRWKPADTVAWMQVMAWDLSGNWRTELGRLRFSAKLGRENAAEILPGAPGEASTPWPDFKALYAEMEPVAGSILARFAPHEEARGSNSWVVSGARSTTGQPILANDPHLGLQAPALWYFAHVATPDRNVVGATLPGVPFIVLGRNDQVAWTLTTTLSDTQDLFVERVAPDDPSSYLTPDGRARFEAREEVIRVGSEERRITVRKTRHGPVISDAVKQAGEAAPPGHVLALAWTALTPENATARAGLRLNRARNRDELIKAVSDFHAPHQNLVFADRDGRIGFVAPALVPVRHPDNEAMGRVPVPGWIAKYDWQGMIPFDQLPAIHDPESGAIVTANNRITPPGYKHFLSIDWMPAYRADRIDELLAAQPKHSVDSFKRMQADTRSRLVRELLPVALTAKPEKPAGRDAQALLKDWNGEMGRDSAAALVFAAWYRELTRLVYADELGDMFRDSWDLRAPFMIAVMKGEARLAHWCDDVRTPAKEACADRASRAFDFAAEDLRARYGEPAGWRWGAAHPAAGDHRPFGAVPMLARIFNVAPETPGDTYSVNVGHFYIRDETRPFANRHAASLRAIYDFADLERSLFMHSTGQSGNFLSPWYANFADRWAKVEYIAIPTRRESIRARHTLTLKP
jgi:penicillin G amidase